MWTTTTAPMFLFLSFVIATALISTVNSLPFFVAKTVFLLINRPFSKAAATGFSLDMLSISSILTPTASLLSQPVKSDATLFINVVIPLTSVVIKAQPINLTALNSHCSLSLSFLSILCLYNAISMFIKSSLWSNGFSM
ncbi:membrane protein [Candidatus Magnetoovum chiemensis]|nr:membrane protein [Candidatus Magnetoovum chiemensis]